MNLRKQSDKLLGHAVGEIFLRRIAAQVLQRKHSQGMNHGAGRCQAVPRFAPVPEGNGNDDDEEECDDCLRPEPPTIYIPCYLLSRWNRNRGGTVTAVVGGVHRRNEPVPPARQGLNVEGVIGGVVQCRP